jgi:hypothetical protein
MLFITSHAINIAYRQAAVKRFFKKILKNFMLRQTYNCATLIISKVLWGIKNGGV